MNSIYFDWNVFQDYFQTRRGQKFNAAIQSVKRKYLTPFSCAHMRDLSRCRNDEYVKNDIINTNLISGGYCIGLSHDNEKVLIEKIPPQVVFDAMKNDSNQDIKDISSFLYFEEYDVAADQLSENNIILPYLRNNNGKMSPQLLVDFIESLKINISNDHKLQKQFRFSLEEVMKLGNPAFEIIKNLSIYKFWLSTKEEISANFESIIASFLSITGKSINSIPFGERITTAYNILVFFPSYWENIDRKNNSRNVATDAEHVLLASSSRYFVCGDEKMVEKAKLVYSTFSIRTKVMSPDEFIDRVKIE